MKFTQLAYVLLSKVRGKDIEFKSGTLDFERITSYELFSVLRFALENVPHMQEVYKTVMADLAAQERASIAGPDDGGGVLAVKKTGDQACPLPPRLEIVDQTTFMLFGIANFARTRFDFEALSNYNPAVDPFLESSSDELEKLDTVVLEEVCRRLAELIGSKAVKLILDRGGKDKGGALLSRREHYGPVPISDGDNDPARRVQLLELIRDLQAIPYRRRSGGEMTLKYPMMTMGRRLSSGM